MPFDASTFELRQFRGQPNGYPTLDATGLVPIEQLPSVVGGSYVSSAQIGAPSGIAPLNEHGLIPLIYLPRTEITMASVVFNGSVTTLRTTITDLNVFRSSQIVHAIRRPNITSGSDPGYLYIANIVTLVEGSFDVLFLVLNTSGAIPGTPPTETIQFCYLVS